MIITKKRFTAAIEELVADKNMNYIDAIVVFCEQHYLDPQSVKHLITPPLKEKIEADATNLNFLKPTKKKGKGNLSQFEK